jgi:hypothetical protein
MDSIKNRQNTIKSEGLALLQRDSGEIKACCAGSSVSALMLQVDEACSLDDLS